MDQFHLETEVHHPIAVHHIIQVQTIALLQEVHLAAHIPVEIVHQAAHIPVEAAHQAVAQAVDPAGEAALVEEDNCTQVSSIIFKLKQIFSHEILTYNHCFCFVFVAIIKCTNIS